MASNRFGTHFCYTSFGESHGKAVGCVLDGCPAGLEISEQEINAELNKRKPGTNPLVSERKEPDEVQILSGVFEGKTTGAPILLIVYNQDADTSKYEAMKDLYRPGHANYTYLQKYGIFDWRGSGRASARETVARVAAGAIALKLLAEQGIVINATVHSIGGIEDEAERLQALHAAKEAGDSLGGVVACTALNVPCGLGEPVYDKIEAKLASAMMSLPATKAFEIGEGVRASSMKGSEHNDAFALKNGHVLSATNHAGGTLGGITTGEPLVIRVHFKPASSIKLEQQTVSLNGQETSYTLPAGSRHDPCVAIRAVPIVKAMFALVLADAYLANKLARV